MNALSSFLPILAFTLLGTASLHAQTSPDSTHPATATAADPATNPGPAPSPTPEAPSNPGNSPEPRPDQHYWHQNYSAQAQKGGIELLFLGDSITQGWNDGGTWIWKQRYAPLKAANFGVGGDRTEHILWRVQNGNFDNIHPKLVVLLAGTNNTKLNTAEQIAEGIKAIVSEIQIRSPESKILLLGIFPRSEKPDDFRRVKITEVNNLISKLNDDKRVFFLDIGQKFLKPDGTISKEIMPDFLHLSAAGYKIWSDAIQEKLEELMK